MNTEERQLTEMLHRVTPEPPRRVTVEDIAFRLANQAGPGRQARYRGRPHREPRLRRPSWGRAWAPALAAASVFVVASTAMPAVAPATTKTLAAARAGAQARPQLGRRMRESRYGRRRDRGRRPGSAWLASRNAISSTVTRRGGSGVMRCSISVSWRSSVFTTRHLRS